MSGMRSRPCQNGGNIPPRSRSAPPVMQSSLMELYNLNIHQKLRRLQDPKTRKLPQKCINFRRHDSCGMNLCGWIYCSKNILQASSLQNKDLNPLQNEAPVKDAYVDHKGALLGHPEASPSMSSRSNFNLNQDAGSKKAYQNGNDSNSHIEDTDGHSSSTGTPLSSTAPTSPFSKDSEEITCPSPSPGSRHIDSGNQDQGHKDNTELPNKEHGPRVRPEPQSHRVNAIDGGQNLYVCNQTDPDVSPILHSPGFMPPLSTVFRAPLNPLYSDPSHMPSLPPAIGGHPFDPSPKRYTNPVCSHYYTYPYVSGGPASSYDTPPVRCPMVPTCVDPVYTQYYLNPSGKILPVIPITSFIPAFVPARNDNYAPGEGTGVNLTVEDQTWCSRVRTSTRKSEFCDVQPISNLFHFPSSPLSSPIFPGSPVYLTPTSRGADEARSSSPTGGYGAPESRLHGIGFRMRLKNPKLHNFLEELKSGNGHEAELSSFMGHIADICTDQQGSRFIQQKLEDGNEDERTFVYEELLPLALDLTVHVFGNYAIQKLFEVGNDEQRWELADELAGHILPFSLQMYGCRVVQKALEVVELDQRERLARELDGHVLRCVHDHNASHVIQKCVECIPTERIRFIVSALRSRATSLSIHPYGCRAIQRVLEHCTDYSLRQEIVSEILDSVYFLSQDQYGNFVIQHILAIGNSKEQSEIIGKFRGHIVQLSRHKYASNVIEKCVEHANMAEHESILDEIFGKSPENDKLLEMMKDQYANYVVQKILMTCTRAKRAKLLERIKAHLHTIKKYAYGKHVFALYENYFLDEEI